MVVAVHVKIVNRIRIEFKHVFTVCHSCDTVKGEQ